jgi:hypothetical protein
VFEATEVSERPEACSWWLNCALDDYEVAELGTMYSPGKCGMCEVAKVCPRCLRSD